MARRETTKERSIRLALNPRSPAEIRVILAYERALARERQIWAAYVFLTEGQEAVEALRIKPSWGRKWSRDYNPLPYPEAKPRGEHRIDMFIGTGVGTIYGLMESEHLIWMLAGWNITSREPEVRRRRKW
jgi:hypothetical protein